MRTGTQNGILIFCPFLILEMVIFLASVISVQETESKIDKRDLIANAMEIVTKMVGYKIADVV
jgi:hypothetical protein